MTDIVSSTKSSLENVVPRPNFKPPEIPRGVTPTKIDVTSGKGVPGEFDGASEKSPAVEVLKMGGAISAISSKAVALTSAAAAIKSGAMASIPGIPNATKVLDGLKTKAMNKLSAAAKAPNFKIRLPTPPRLPSIPNFASMGIPNVPSLPNVSLPSAPALPSVNVPKLPSVSTVPKLPSVNVPKLPSLSG